MSLIEVSNQLPNGYDISLLKCFMVLIKIWNWRMEIWWIFWHFWNRNNLTKKMNIEAGGIKLFQFGIELQTGSKTVFQYFSTKTYGFIDFKGAATTLNPYPWILGKNPKGGTITERVFRKKNPERSIASICICSCALKFFPESALGDGPKNGIYFCWARHISSNIGICHLKFAP